MSFAPSENSTVAGVRLGFAIGPEKDIAAFAEMAGLGWYRARQAVSTPEYRPRSELRNIVQFHHCDRLATRATSRHAAASRTNSRASSATRDVRGRAEAALNAWIEANGLEVASVREALASGDAWVDEVTGRLDRLREALAAAEGGLQECRRKLAGHEETGRPEINPDDIAARRAEQEQEQARLAERQVEERGRLRDDERDRAAAEALRERIDRQRPVTEAWQSLSEVIGSASGDKFRRFAQTLTLEHLIALANTHRAELTLRYRLEAIRGGERFLVSLALALGLASMTGHRTRIDSLFIDEGFGTLEPAAWMSPCPPWKRCRPPDAKWG